MSLLLSSCVLNGSWVVLPAAAPSGASADFVNFTDVSCTTADFCMAVGVHDDTELSDPPSNVYEWDGSRWSEVTGGPQAAGERLTINPKLVSCGNPHRCAVGYDFVTAQGEIVGGFSLWDGSTWTRVPLTVPTVDFGTSFDCAPDGSCVFADTRVATVVFDGSEFETIPIAAQPVPDLDELDCFGPRLCLGRGYDLQRWDGDRWQAIASFPRTSSEPGWRKGWTSLACTSPTNCLAVGAEGTWSSLVTPNVEHPIAAHYDGTTWTMTDVPIEGGTIEWVSCADAAACVAVLGNREAVAWIGNQWFTVPNVPLVRVRALSCAGERCLAVGDGAGSSRPPAATSYDWSASS